MLMRIIYIHMPALMLHPDDRHVSLLRYMFYFNTNTLAGRNFGLKLIYLTAPTIGNVCYQCVYWGIHCHVMQNPNESADELTLLRVTWPPPLQPAPCCDRPRPQTEWTTEPSCIMAANQHRVRAQGNATEGKMTEPRTTEKKCCKYMSLYRTSIIDMYYCCYYPVILLCYSPRQMKPSGIVNCQPDLLSLCTVGSSYIILSWQWHALQVNSVQVFYCQMHRTTQGQTGHWSS